MYTLFLVALAVIAVVYGADYPKVKLETYYEALCPGCQQFITGPLTNVMAMADIAAIVDLKMGNTKKNADGSFTCQHGVDECTSDVYEMCTLYKLSGDINSISRGETSSAAFPYLQCMEVNEGNPKFAQSCFTQNMAQTNLTWSTVSNCYSQEYSAVQNAGAKATVTHDYVPWVLVDGSLLSNTNLLLNTICSDYTGPKPPSCKRLESANSVCMNN